VKIQPEWVVTPGKQTNKRQYKGQEFHNSGKQRLCLLIISKHVHEEIQRQ
jgi:hypothetical protein